MGFLKGNPRFMEPNLTANLANGTGSTVPLPVPLPAGFGFFAAGLVLDPATGFYAATDPIAVTTL